MTAPDRTAGRNERGAVVVEFALVLPLLLFLVFGIVEYGRAYNVKVELTGSVREGARALALGGSRAEAKQAVRDAAPGLNPALDDDDIIIFPCPADGAGGNANATVIVNYDLPTLVLSGDIQLHAKGVMRCEL